MTLYTQPVSGASEARAVPLTYDQRQRSRLFLHLNAEETAHIILPRGLRLSPGLQIKAEDGSVVRIESAGEEVSFVEARGLALARACYQLGSRHIPASITEAGVCYPRDPLIDELMKGLGFTIEHGSMPFEPDNGALQRHEGGLSPAPP